jgi:hypothetical protein
MMLVSALVQSHREQEAFVQVAAPNPLPVKDVKDVKDGHRASFDVGSNGHAIEALNRSRALRCQARIAFDGRHGDATAFDQQSVLDTQLAPDWVSGTCETQDADTNSSKTHHH